MKAYKGFDSDLSCRGFRYEVGKTYETNKADLCNSGFHACEYPLDVFNYYPPEAGRRFAEVECDGTIAKGDNKLCSTRIEVKSELSLPALCNAAVSFVMKRVKKAPSKANLKKDQSAASNTGDYSAASNTGNRSAASNTGDYSAASNTGNQSAASNTGNQSAASNTGYQSAASNTGDYSAASNTGDYSAASNTGDYSAASNTGYQSAALTVGVESKADVSGKDSIAAGLGIANKASGSLGCWIVLAEWVEAKGKWTIKNVKTAKVDGKKIKAGKFYELKDGKFVEAE